MDTIELYESYAKKIGNRDKIYEAVQKAYKIKSDHYRALPCNLNQTCLTSLNWL